MYLKQEIGKKWIKNKKRGNGLPSLSEVVTWEITIKKDDIKTENNKVKNHDPIL